MLYCRRQAAADGVTQSWQMLSPDVWPDKRVFYCDNVAFMFTRSCHRELSGRNLCCYNSTISLCEKTLEDHLDTEISTFGVKGYWTLEIDRLESVSSSTTTSCCSSTAGLPWLTVWLIGYVSVLIWLCDFLGDVWDVVSVYCRLCVFCKWTGRTTETLSTVWPTMEQVFKCLIPLTTMTMTSMMSSISSRFFNIIHILF